MLKPKVILFDVDGVLVKYSTSFFEELERRGHADAVRTLLDYYREENVTVRSEGRGREQELVQPYLERLGWAGTAEEFLDAQGEFAGSHVDEKMMAVVGTLRAQGVKCCLATNQGPYQARFLLEKLGWREKFDRAYLSCELGCRKSGAGFWQQVLDDIGREMGAINSWEIVFFDDQKENVDLAASFGIQSFLFTGNIQFEKDMNLLGFEVVLNEYLS